MSPPQAARLGQLADERRPSGPKECGGIGMVRCLHHTGVFGEDAHKTQKGVAWQYPPQSASCHPDAWYVWSWCREACAPAMAQAARECGIRLRIGEQRILLLGTPIVDVWIASHTPTNLDAFWARVAVLSEGDDHGPSP